MNIHDASGGDIEPQRYWCETELTQVSVTNSQPHRTPPNAGGRFLLSSPQSGLILRHCSIVSYTYAGVSEKLIMKVDRHITMNR